MYVPAEFHVLVLLSLHYFSRLQDPRSRCLCSWIQGNMFSGWEASPCLLHGIQKQIQEKYVQIERERDRERTVHLSLESIPISMLPTHTFPSLCHTVKGFSYTREREGDVHVASQ